MRFNMQLPPQFEKLVSDHFGPITDTQCTPFAEVRTTNSAGTKKEPYNGHLATNFEPEDPMASQWKSWAGLTIDGVFPLIRFIAEGEHSVVFETEYRDGGKQRAAIKFVNATLPNASQILEDWQAASSLAHPSLLQILAGGESEIGDDAYIYVVTELADDSLKNVLPDRKLSAQETRDMLGGVLNALRHLHSKGFVHGHLSPSNVMAVGDQLKIPADNATQSSDVDVDVRELGRLLQAVLPQPLPEPFDEIVEGCVNSSDPYTLDQIESSLRGASNGSAAGSDSSQTPRASAPILGKKEFNPLLLIGGGGMALLVILVLVLWLGGDSFRMENFASSNPSPSDKNTKASAQGQQGAAPATKANENKSYRESANKDKEKEDEVQTGKSVGGSAIAKRVLPDIPRRDRETINGRVAISIKVDVDPEGNVTNATSLSPKASKFFTKYALDAAREWKFTPKEEPKALVIKFLLRRTETEVSVAEALD
jgi:TonB family protein